MIREYIANAFWMLVHLVSDWINPQPYRVTLTKRRLPIDWLGADETYGAMLERMGDEPVDLSKSRSQVVLSLHAQRARNAERTLRERVRHDELGSWDPDAQDWSAPAIFQETSLDALRGGMFRDVVRDDPELVDHAMDLVLATV